MTLNSFLETVLYGCMTAFGVLIFWKGEALYDALMGPSKSLRNRISTIGPHAVKLIAPGFHDFAVQLSRPLLKCLGVGLFIIGLVKFLQALL